MHAITINSLTGKTEACYAERPAWHNLGTVETDLSDANFRQRSNLCGWRSEKQAIQTVKGVPVPGQFAVVRQDTNQVLGLVGDRYHIYHPEDMFDFMSSLSDTLEYEAAFSMFDSTQICVVARMKGDTKFEIMPGDETQSYVMGLTSFDGSCRITYTPTTIRTVCNNTVQASLAKHRNLVRTVKHTENHMDKLLEVKTYLQEFCGEFREYAERCKLLAAKNYTEDSVPKFFAELFPIPGVDASTRAKNLYGEVQSGLVQSYHHRTNNLPGMQGTLWQLFNVVTYYVDHLSNGYRSEDTNVDSILFGKKAELKQKAFELCSQMAS